MFSAEAGWTVAEAQTRPRPGGLRHSASERDFRALGAVRVGARGQLRSASPASGVLGASPAGGAGYPKGKLASSSSCSSTRAAAAHRASSFDYDEWRGRFEREYQQRQRCSSLAVPKRQRFVEATLLMVQDRLDPAEGLEAAAAAAAAEAEAEAAALRSQGALCAALARPRPPPAPASPAEAGGPAPARSRAEQRARCEELSRRPAALCPAVEPDPPRPARSALEQRRACAGLAQPRPRGHEEPAPGCAEDPAAEEARRALAARASAQAPEDVRQARALLAAMQASQAAAAAAAARARPASAGRRSPKASPAEAPAAVGALRALAEELLWVVLLAVRSCPREPGSELHDRLASLLLSIVGPALRPVARRVLAPGSGTARRLRTEFPRLWVHLGFRESDDAEPLHAAPWGEAEAATLAGELRACRDKLLNMDLASGALAG